MQDQIHINMRDSSELNYMINNLHQMLRFMGKQQVGNTNIKMDQFERLRIAFTSSAQNYQKATIKLQKNSNPQERVLIRNQIGENKKQMDVSLKQMTTITTKLNYKVKRNKLNEKDQETISKEIEYKNLTIYHCQKIYFKLIKKQKDIPTARQLQQKYMTLEQILQKGPALWEDQQEDLEEKQLLQALKRIDDMIQQKMDQILNGINTMHSNALTISQSINIVHKKVLMNLHKVNQNNQILKKNQKLMNQASKHTSKPGCIVNIIILILLAIVAYLIITIFIINDSNSDQIGS